MPLYLVSFSQRVVYEQFVQAENEDIARIEAMKFRMKPFEVKGYGMGVDSVEEFPYEVDKSIILYA